MALAAGNVVTSHPDPEPGAVEGQVLSIHLEPIEAALLELVQDEDVLYSTETNVQGEYTFPEVEPGDYRLEVSAEGFYPHGSPVVVTSGQTKTINFVLEPAPFPWVEHGDWTGFISCWLAGVTDCALLDANQSTSLVTDVEEGLRTASVALVWDNGPLLSADEFRLLITNDDGDVLADEIDGSPLEIRIDDQFAGTSALWYDVEPASSPVVYQQQFMLYWAYHYLEPAPPGYSPLPEA